MTVRRTRPAPSRLDTPAARPAAPPVRAGRRRLAELTGSWRAALRIARRESRRARRRTALVLAMIALPVAVLAFLAASYDMAVLTGQEQVDRRLGVADAELRWISDTPLDQDEWGDSWTARDGTQRPTTARATTAQVSALLGPGSRVTEMRSGVRLTLRGPHRDEDMQGRVLDLGDPLARGLVRFRAGRAPEQPGEVAVSPAALRLLNLRLGRAVALADGSRAYTVVGVVEFPDDLGAVVALHPGAVPRTGPEPESSWLVDVPGTIDAALVSRLNDRGVLVAARPPNESAAERKRIWLGPVDPGETTDLGTGVLIAGLGLLEVVLLVGPAFAVGVRRRRRDLALVAVAGGDAAQLRRVVLADGVVLGVLGAATGLLVGVGAAFAGRPLMEQYVFDARFGGYRCWPIALLLLGAVAVLAGVLAALAPAWTAARQDVSAGLAGRRTPPVSQIRWLAFGLSLVAGGVGLAAFGASRTSTVVILTGLILGELGLVCCTPTLIGALARLGRALPLAPRIALRDASRNRAAAAPAICAVMAAVASSVALGGFLASSDARSSHAYRPMLPTGHVLVYAGESVRQPSLTQLAAMAREQWGADRIAPVNTVSCAPEVGYCDVAPVLPPAQVCPWQPGDKLSAAHRRQARADRRCRIDPMNYDGGYVQTGVDDGAALPLLTGADPATTAAATAVLRAGGVVVTEPRYLHDGLVTVRVNQVDPGTDRPGPTADFPGYALHGVAGQSHLLLSGSAARHLGLTWSPAGWVIGAPTPPDRQQRERFASALRPFGTFSMSVEYGRDSHDISPLLLLLAAAAGVITMGAAGIATALAAAEGRAELTTLAAVGAAPALRRMLAICQAGVIAGLGSVLGIVAGLGTAAIVLFSANRQYANDWPVPDRYPYVVPWPALGVLVLVPIVAMLGAGLFTRARLPIERRLD
ncbi:FtsX-like permease family protein [Micromonospora sp. NPDC049175]|uniref:FtsX-like permease family protein n=1 Tax=Micromonospora sp. NPDC049175 TaxID=3364266 RepID=UPI00372364ED